MGSINRVLHPKVLVPFPIVPDFSFYFFSLSCFIAAKKVTTLPFQLLLAFSLVFYPNKMGLNSMRIQDFPGKTKSVSRKTNEHLKKGQLLLLVRSKFENPFKIGQFCLWNGFHICCIFHFLMWSILEVCCSHLYASVVTFSGQIRQIFEAQRVFEVCCHWRKMSSISEFFRMF